VHVDLACALFAVTEESRKRIEKPTRLMPEDYFGMDDDEPPGSFGGTDSDEHQFMPAAQRDAVEEAERGKEPGSAEKEAAETQVSIVMPAPNNISEEEKVAWDECLRILNQNPKLREPPAHLKRKFSGKQIVIWDEVKIAIRREKKKIYQSSKKKATVQLVGHHEEPEYAATQEGRGRAPPPTQPSFTANERASEDCGGASKGSTGGDQRTGEDKEDQDAYESVRELSAFKGSKLCIIDGALRAS
jgi:hypothetical protein